MEQGEDAARALLCNGVDFYGFCGRRGPAAFPDGLLGKPVISPDELIHHAEEFYVSVFAEGDSYIQIMDSWRNVPFRRIIL